MTRINTINVKILSRKHLIAEYKELPRIFNFVKKYGVTDLGNVYILGKGHVKFFTNKLNYCRNRFNELRDEMIARGYTVNYPAIELDGDIEWTPSVEDVQVNLNRLIERDSDYYSKVSV